MATATERRYTPEDLLKIGDRLMPELVDGELVEREPMGQEADSIASRLIVLLGIYSRILPGLINGAHCSYQIFPDDPSKVRIPDVSFTRRERVPGGKSARGHSRIVPDLVVEVISPNDLASELQSKLEDYDRAGVPCVWVINPDTRNITVIAKGETSRIYGQGEVIGGIPTMPGFECLVDDLFEG